MKEHALVIALKNEELWWTAQVYDLTDPNPDRLPVAEKSARDWRKAVRSEEVV